MILPTMYWASFVCAVCFGFVDLQSGSLPLYLIVLILFLAIAITVPYAKIKIEEKRRRSLNEQGVIVTQYERLSG